MGTCAALQETAEESAVIQAGAAHHDGDLRPLAKWRACRRRSCDREPVVQREWLVRLCDIDPGMGSGCKEVGRQLVSTDVETTKDLPRIRRDQNGANPVSVEERGKLEGGGTLPNCGRAGNREDGRGPLSGRNPPPASRG